jgi:hypothetical protein
LTAEVRRSEPRYTDLELSVYGHVGDGDLHYNVLVPPEVDRIEFTKRIESGLSLQLYDTAAALGGTLARSTASVGSRSIFLNHRAAKATGRFPRSIDTDRTHTRRLAGAPALACRLEEIAVPPHRGGALRPTNPGVEPDSREKAFRDFVRSAGNTFASAEVAPMSACRTAPKAAR